MKSAANITAFRAIGAMDKRVTVQTFTTTRSLNGAQVNTWVDLTTIWAAIDYATTGNSEQYIGDQEMSESRVLITVRYRGDIKPKMRFVYNVDGTNTQTFDVLFSKIIGRRKFEQFTCASVE